ncbi:MAG: hypothetical protein ACREEP_04740 [Dongiaceae bacterium]
MTTDPKEVGAGASARTEAVASESAGATRTQQFGAAGHEQVIDVGMDEAIAAHVGQGFGQSTFDEGMRRANMKRTYDQHQSVDLISLGNAQGHAAQISQLSVQALQNAVETANMVSKQAVRHGDLAIDHQWNLDEQANMAAVVASVVASVLARLGTAPGATGQTGEPKP